MTACPDENALIDFVEGRSSESDRDGLHSHLDGCEACRVVVGALARAASPEHEPALARGDRIDRFVILEELGRGGMGVVYAAFDPELERKIALKVIAPRGDEEPSRAQKRLLSEAQALARLAHPNVVTVHEARSIGERVFIAMERVSGATARKVLRQDGWSWRRVLALYLGAGEGLHAAHQAGIVHRDFKPDNVLVGEDGRARVTDFGLARVSRPEGRSHRPREEDGVVVGTPAYMSPEQWRGHPGDARSDQFSFCVSLYEALCGERPFPTSDAATFHAALSRGLPETTSRKLPGQLRRALARGLSVEPTDRFPSMRELLEALRREPWVRLRGWLAVGGAVALAALGVAFGHWAAAPEPVCQGAESHFAGIWDGEVKARIRAALGKDDAFHGVERALDGYERAWTRMHREACEATRVRGEQSEAMLDLRAACLERRVRDVKALVTLFENRGASAAGEAVQAAYALPGLQECADLSTLAAEVKPPQGGEARAQVAEVDARLSEVRALSSAGRLTEALEQARTTATLARQAQHPPTLAQALLELGVLEEKRGEAPSAEKTLLESAWQAEAGHADRTAARARIELLRTVGELAGRSDAVPNALAEAKAALARVGQDPDLDATLEITQASVLNAEDHCEQALPHLERALALADRAWDEGDPRRAQVLQARGIAQRCVGALDAALESHQAALALRERTFGKDHPEVAESLNSIANVLFAKQDFEGALPFHQRALGIREETLGHSGAVLAGSVLNVGVDLISIGREGEGRTYALRALQLYEDALGKDSPRLAMPLLVLGHVEVDLGTPKEAEARLERALRLLTGRDDEQTAMARFNLARALRSEHRQATRARALALQARHYFERRKDARATQLATIDEWLARRSG